MQKITENLEKKKVQKFRNLLLNRKKLNLPRKLSQIPLPAVEIGKMPRSWRTRSWHSPGLWPIRVSHMLCTAERIQQPPSQPPQHPTALFLLGMHSGPGRSRPMGRRWVSSASRAGDGCSCPGDPGVSGCVKQFLSTDICGTGASVLGELLERFYF